MSTITIDAVPDEHDRVVSTVDMPEEELVAGDVGTVVHLWRDGAAFEVEFFTLGALRKVPEAKQCFWIFSLFFLAG